MSPDRPPARRRWFRCTSRRLMIALPVIALAIILLAGIDPFRRDPSREAVARAERWCAIDVDPCQTDYLPLPPSSKAELLWALAQCGSTALPCLLKIDDMAMLKCDSNLKLIGTDGTRIALAEDGRFARSQQWSVGPVRSDGGLAEILSPERLRAIRRLLPTLPASRADIPAGLWVPGSHGMPPQPGWRTPNRTIVFGFRDRGAWVTRVYDKEQPPPEVVALLAQLGYGLPLQPSYAPGLPR